jgi:hypothetical protein
VEANMVEASMTLILQANSAKQNGLPKNLGREHA